MAVGARLLATFIGSLTLAIGARAAAPPPNDYLLILDRRAGPYRYYDSFDRGKSGAYEAALAAFGQPTRFRQSANFCDVTWAQAGITVGFAQAFSRKGCATANLFRAAWYGMTLHGPRWHNQLGVRVGDGVAKVRRLYPQARFDSEGRPWLVLLRLRVDEFDFIRLAVAVNRVGRVTSIEVPPTYIF